jgi:hypothetical protein
VISRDEALSVGLVLAFAALVTAHLTLVAGLAGRKPRWRALVALLVLPLAPAWGRREGFHVRTVIWAVSAVAYAVLLWRAAH